MVVEEKEEEEELWLLLFVSFGGEVRGSGS